MDINFAVGFATKVEDLNHQYAELAWERENLLVDVHRIEAEMLALEQAITTEDEGLGEYEDLPF